MKTVVTVDHKYVTYVFAVNMNSVMIYCTTHELQCCIVRCRYEPGEEYKLSDFIGAQNRNSELGLN